MTLPSVMISMAPSYTTRRCATGSAPCVNTISPAE